MQGQRRSTELAVSAIGSHLSILRAILRAAQA
jgi:hypothetical protein